MNLSYVINLSLLLTHIETVFLGTPYFAATSLLGIKLLGKKSNQDIQTFEFLLLQWINFHWG